MKCTGGVEDAAQQTEGEWMNGLGKSDRDRKGESWGSREGQLSRETGSLGSAFSATQPSSSNGLMLW